MQDLNPGETLPQEQENKGCVLCGHPEIAPQSRSQLCPYCRESAIKFKVPRWVLLFAAGVMMVLAIAIYRSPSNFDLGLHMARGKKAVDARNFLTAQKEFEYVLRKMPEFREGQARLMMASFYNQDFNTFVGMLNGLEGQPIEDEELFTQLNSVVDQARHYFPSDSLTAYIEHFGEADAIPESRLLAYTTQFPEDLYALQMLASRKSDQDEYGAADSILNLILQRQADYYPSLCAKTAVKRMLGQVDSCIVYADMILYTNQESSFAYSAKSRACLYRHQDQLGLQLAKKAVALDSTDGYAIASLALAHHFTGNVNERDQLQRRMSRDSGSATYLEYVNDVISGKEIFRKN